jgi:hypothetical protein
LRFDFFACDMSENPRLKRANSVGMVLALESEGSRSMAETRVRKEASTIDKALGLLIPLIGIVIFFSATTQGQQPRARQVLGWTVGGVVLNIFVYTCAQV